MAQRVVREDPALLDHLVERQHEIAGDAEDFAGAVVLQTLQQGDGEHGAIWPICHANAKGSRSMPARTSPLRDPYRCGSELARGKAARNNAQALHLMVLLAFQDVTWIAVPPHMPGPEGVPQTSTAVPGGIHGLAFQRE